jgi:phage shock protein PspC (stress-responsive transcriptional regulator)
MNRTMLISLSGHAKQFRLEEGAYERLAQYLDRAAARLQGDPDRAEVLGDLERSIGERLGALIGSEDRLVTAADIDGVLEAIGAVETGHEPVSGEGRARPRSRRLQRVREGQQIAGVCTGLAAYSEIDVDWIRILFVLGTLVTAGILGLVYIALAFILPVAATRADV